MSGAADYVGMTDQELEVALQAPETCPLCSEVGGERHDPEMCLVVLDVWADRDADARNSGF